MNSITIHGLDPQLEKLIKEKAKLNGTSINKTVKSLLEKSLGVKPVDKNDHKREFEGFFGKWSRSELQEFEDSTRELNSCN